ncbi:hypothetical protein RUND412_001793 [Rhizina undulata]
MHLKVNISLREFKVRQHPSTDVVTPSSPNGSQYVYQWRPAPSPSRRSRESAESPPIDIGIQARVREAFEAKWRKSNDLLTYVPGFGCAPGKLKGKISSGREFHELKGWELKGLSGEKLRALREPRMDVEEAELEALRLKLAEESEEEGKENVGYARQGGYY